MSKNSRFVSRLTRETLAMVMAGGRGSRLMQLTASRAKPAVPFGGSFRIIDFTLSNCINSGIRRIGVLTQYKSYALLRHLHQGWGFLRGHFGEFVELLPAEQRTENPSWYSGTADAVFQNIEFIRQHQPAYVLILAGDHIYKMDYGAMLAQHVRSGARVTIGCLEVPRSESRHFGVMHVGGDGRVLGFDEKPAETQGLPDKPDSILASMGIYVFDARYLLDWLQRDAGVHESSHDFARDVIPIAIGEGAAYAHRFTDLRDASRQGYWRDVGTVDAYWQANQELIGVLPELNLYDEDWPIWTTLPYVPPAKFVLNRQGLRGMATDSLVSGGCIVTGARVDRSVMFVKSRVEPGSVVKESLLLPGAVVGRNCYIRRAIIDENCVIPDGTVIGGQEQDALLYHVSPGGVTLVTPPMLQDQLQAPPAPPLSVAELRRDRPAARH